MKFYISIFLLISLNNNKIFGDIILNEVNIRYGWVELKNTETTTVDLTNMYFRCAVNQNGELETLGAAFLSGSMTGNSYKVITFSALGLSIDGSKSIVFYIAICKFLIFFSIFQMFFIE